MNRKNNTFDEGEESATRFILREIEEKQLGKCSGIYTPLNCGEIECTKCPLIVFNKD